MGLPAGDIEADRISCNKNNVARDKKKELKNSNWSSIMDVLEGFII